MKIFEWLKNMFSCKKPNASGDIVLGYGLHEIKINVSHVCKVYVCIKDEGCPVCQGDINKIGVQIVDNGFILYADIKTNCCIVEWTCE